MYKLYVVNLFIYILLNDHKDPFQFVNDIIHISVYILSI